MDDSTFFPGPRTLAGDLYLLTCCSAVGVWCLGAVVIGVPLALGSAVRRAVARRTGAPRGSRLRPEGIHS